MTYYQEILFCFIFFIEFNTKESGGLTKVLQNGKVFEKAGVSIKVSRGKLTKKN